MIVGMIIVKNNIAASLGHRDPDELFHRSLSVSVRRYLHAPRLTSRLLSNSARLRTVQVISQEGESHTLFGWLAATADACGNLAKRVRRRLPQDGSAERISYPDQVRISYPNGSGSACPRTGRRRGSPIRIR